MHNYTIDHDIIIVWKFGAFQDLGPVGICVQSIPKRQPNPAGESWWIGLFSSRDFWDPISPYKSYDVHFLGVTGSIFLDFFWDKFCFFFGSHFGKILLCVCFFLDYKSSKHIKKHLLKPWTSMDERLLMEGSFPQVLLFFVSYIGGGARSCPSRVPPHIQKHILRNTFPDKQFNQGESKGNPPNCHPQCHFLPPPTKKNKATLRD